MYCRQGYMGERHCPVCRKPEPPQAHDLWCGDCVHKRLMVSRNLVVHNEALNRAMQHDISAILALCRAIQLGEPVHLDFESPKELRPESAAVKLLAHQLQKVEFVKRRGRLVQFERLIKTLNERNSAAREAVAERRTELQRCSDSIEQAMALLSRNHQLAEESISERTRAETDHAHVVKQARALQQRHFEVLRLALFPTYHEWRAGRQKLIFCYRRILELPELRNTRVSSTNTFLEDCITLQLHLARLYKGAHMPYLDALLKLIPNGAFYEQMQTKLNALFGTVPEEPPEAVIEEESDKVIIKDKVIRIPKSSRTANLQRRASVKPPEKVEEPKPLASSKKHVLVPHRILTKPLDKLGDKEYQRFVLIVVRILVNFHAFLAHTGHATDEVHFETLLGHVASLDYFEAGPSAVAVPRELDKVAQIRTIYDRLTKRDSIYGIVSEAPSVESEKSVLIRPGDVMERVHGLLDGGPVGQRSGC